MTTKARILRLAILLMVPLLGACTSVPRDAGVGEVENLIATHLRPGFELPRNNRRGGLTEAELTQVLDAPVGIVDAERIALLRHPAVVRNLSRVGVAEADFAQAGRIRNPGFSYTRFSGREYEASLLFDIGGLVLMPLRREMQSRRLGTVRYAAAREILSHLQATRQAWINAVAEKHIATTIRKAVASAEVTHQLKVQMSELGHSHRIDLAHSTLLLGDLRNTLKEQELAELAAREALSRHLALIGDFHDKLDVPGQLPTLPATPRPTAEIDAKAISRRLDVRLAALNLESTGRNLELTRLNPFFSALELGPVVERTAGNSEGGVELEFHIPLFDTGAIKTQKARFIFEQADAQAREVAINAASQTRIALANYRSRFDIARYHQDVARPLREQISREKLLRYNGMLISVFELLDDARESLEAEVAAINSLREFWQADSYLQQALVGSSDARMNFSGSGFTESGQVTTDSH